MSMFTASVSDVTKTPNKRTIRSFYRSTVINSSNEEDVGCNEGYTVSEEDEYMRSSSTARDEHVYTYDEAINLAGNGFYNKMLFATLSVASLSMAVDIFGFSVVVTGASCEFNIGITETGILLSVTFIGPILMAFLWGYVSDTQGRRKSLAISLWTSFLVSAASSFSPNWIVLAVLKFISCSFSGCAQSASFTLLGECCSRRYRDAYMLIMTSIMNSSLAVYVVIAYFILNMDFAYDLGYVIFSPWRFLSIVLSVITGLGAVGILFFYESPKFLLNFERNDEALEVLAGIWKRNGGTIAFPVKKIILSEVGNERVTSTNISIWRSFWLQLVPIFKPPLLWKSLQLFSLTAVVYGTNNSYYIWLPYLVEQVMNNDNSNTTNENTNICDIISFNDTNHGNTMDCYSGVDISLVWFSLAEGISFLIVMVLLARVAHRKRFLTTVILLVASLSGVGAVLIEDMTASFLMLLVMLFNDLAIGFIYSYFVQLYPTSYRGMAACLGTMVARISALAGVSVLGALLETHCTQSFYLSSALMLGGVFVALLLPKDGERPRA